MIFISIVTLDINGRPSVSEDTCEQVVAEPALCRCFSVSRQTVNRIVLGRSHRQLLEAATC